jgi:hypothetical protein
VPSFFRVFIVSFDEIRLLTAHMVPTTVKDIATIAMILFFMS